MTILFVTDLGIEEFPPSGGGATVLAGDVTGPSGGNTVSLLQGQTLTITVPLAAGEVLAPDAGGTAIVNADIATVLGYDPAANLGALGIPDPTRAHDGQVVTTTGGAYGLAAPSSGVTIGTAGADASRPAASTGLIGSIYTATDTAIRYLCESDGSGGARWCVVGRHQYEGRDTTLARLGATRTAASNVSISAGTILSGAMVFSLGALPSGGLYLLTCNAPVTGNGWRLSIGDVPGARGRLMSYRQGMGTAFAELTTAVAAADNAMHCIAWSWKGATVRYSWDGAAVATASHGSGTMSAGTGPIRIGADAFFTAAPDADIAAIKLWSTLVGDADLEAIAAAYATGRIPDVAGSTVVFDWHAARYVEGLASQVCVRGTAQRLVWSAAPPMVIR